MMNDEPNAEVIKALYASPALLDAIQGFYDACPDLLDKDRDTIPKAAYLADYFDPALNPPEEAEADIIAHMLMETDHYEQTESAALHIIHTLEDLGLLTIERNEPIFKLGAELNWYMLHQLFDLLEQTIAEQYN